MLIVTVIIVRLLLLDVELNTIKAIQKIGKLQQQTIELIVLPNSFYRV